MAGKIAPEPEQLEREVKIIELRRAGMTWEKVAANTGYAGASGAYKAYQRAAERMVRPHIEELRDIELDRLDRLQLAVWEKAKNGDYKAIQTVLSILDRRTRILGLDAPTKIQAEVITYDGDTLNAYTNRLIELARYANANDNVETIAVGQSPSETGATA
jgi:hypothetical protein